MDRTWIVGIMLIYLFISLSSVTVQLLLYCFLYSHSLLILPDLSSASQPVFPPIKINDKILLTRRVKGETHHLRFS